MKRVQKIGLCWEGPDNARSGAAAAPALVRWGAESAETYSLLQQRDAPEALDFGDRPFFDIAPELAVSAMEDALQSLLDPKAPVLVLGGDHLVMLAVLRWRCAQGETPTLLHVDAHADRRDAHGGERFSHATVVRRAEELLGPSHVHSVGLRSRAPEEPWEAERMTAFDVADPLERAVRQLPARAPLHLTVDLDVLDPGTCPAVSNAEPDGIGLRELVSGLTPLAGRLHSADLVELLPTGDGAAVSAQCAGIVQRELLAVLGTE